MTDKVAYHFQYPRISSYGFFVSQNSIVYSLNYIFIGQCWNIANRKIGQFWVNAIAIVKPDPLILFVTNVH